MAPAVPTLYVVPYHSSSMPHQVLLELDVPASEFVVKALTAEVQQKDPEFQKISHRRKVPAVHFPDGTSIVEAGAIVFYMLERFDKEGKLHPLPTDGHSVDRARFLQGIVYAVTEGYKTAMVLFFLCYNIEKKDRDQTKLEAAKDTCRVAIIDHLLKELKQGQRKYYLGDKFSAADIMMGYMLMTMNYCDCGMMDNEIINEYFGRLTCRPAYKTLFMPIS